MAEEQNQTICTTGHGHEAVEMEVKDRGLFDFMGKKKKKEEEEDEKKCEELLVTEMEKVSVEETKEEGNKVEYEGEKEKDKHGFLEKLHRSHSSSSISSSDEEEDGEGGEKRKKKKGLKEKIKEKLHGDNKEEDGEEKKSAEAEVVVEASVVTVDDTSIKVERLDESVKLEETPVEEKKGFLEKIKEKLPGHGQYKKPTAEEAVASSECAVEHGKEHEGEGQKKGFLEKIKEKLPGYHKNGGEECGPAATTKSP